MSINFLFTSWYYALNIYVVISRLLPVIQLSWMIISVYFAYEVSNEYTETVGYFARVSTLENLRNHVLSSQTDSSPVLQTAAALKEAVAY